MVHYSFFHSWLAVLCAILGTMIWRVAGVMLAARIPAEGPIMGWVNTMAYALVAAVLMLIFVHPIGVLATTNLDQRVVGLAAGLLIMFFTKRLILSLFFGVGAFALAIEFI